MTRAAVIVLAVLAIALAAAPCAAQAPTWEPIGPYGGRVLALAAAPQDYEDGMLASTVGGGLFASSDGGESWEPVAGVPVDLTVSAIAYSPGMASDGLIYVASTQSGVLRSEDGGDTWSPWSTGLPSLSVSDLAISPGFAQDQTVLVATGRGLARSPSAGKRWFAVGPTLSALSCELAVRGDGALVAFAGTSLGLYRSGDGGATWAQATLPAVPIVDIAVSPDFRSDDTLVVGSLGGAFLSTDGGETWDSPWFEDQVVHSMTFCRSGDESLALFAGTDSGLYRSHDGGTTWGSVPILDDVANALLTVGTAEMLFAGGNALGIQYSADTGTAWEPRNQGLMGIEVEALATAPSFALHPLVIAGGPTGLYSSRDGGDAWSPIALADTKVCAITFPPHYAQSGRVYAATDEGAFVSPDRGDSWVATPASPASLDLVNVCASSLAGDLWVASREQGVYYTPDDGATWEARSTGLSSLRMTSLLWIRGTGDSAVLLAGTWGFGTFVSVDGGLTWARSDAPPATPYVRALEGTVGFGEQTWAFCATAAGLFRSGDGGRRWDFAGLLGQDLSDIAAHPDYASRSNLYVSSRHDGVFRSLNGGLTWQPLNEGLNSLDVHTVLAATESSDPLLYAAGPSGVWRRGSVPEPPSLTIVLPLVMQQSPLSQVGALGQRAPRRSLSVVPDMGRSRARVR